MRADGGTTPVGIRALLALRHDDGTIEVQALGRASEALAAAVERVTPDAAGGGGAGAVTSVAVHVGEVDLDASGSPVGAPVEVVQALLRSSHPGQALATPEAIELGRGALVQGLEVQPLGTHRLRGATEPIAIVQVAPPGGIVPFPPLRNADPPGAALPVPDSSFIGRERDLAALVDLILDNRLVSIVGPGGCGKTRLAVEVARMLGGRFPGGVVWVDLGPVTSGEAVADAVASSIGLRSIGRPDPEQVAALLAPREALVLVDNCEHVVDAASTFVSAIRSSGTQVLATSREPLALSGEVVWRVPSLSVPTDADGGDLDESDAGRLLQDRMRRARPDRWPDGDAGPSLEERAAMAAICRRLDGIPLAIELAAARSATIPPVELAELLAERFTLLAAGGRDVIERQRTIEASVAWSHHLLDEVEQRAFRRLGAFTGSFPADAAAEISAAPGRGGEEVLDRLLACSLIIEQTEHGQRRLRMLESVRWSAREHLVASGEAEQVFGRHLDRCVEVARSAGRTLEASTVREGLAVLDAEVDDLRAAMHWAIANGRGDDVARIVAATAWFWIWRGRLPEANRWLADSEADAAALGRAERLDLLWAKAMLLNTAGSNAHEQVALDGIALARELGDDGAEVRFLVSRSRHQAFTDPHAVLAEADGHRERCRRAGDRFWAATSLMAEALAQITLGRFDLAEPILDRMAREAAIVGHPQLIADERARRSTVDRRLGRHDAVLRSAADIDAITAGFTDFNSQALAHAQAALVHITRGHAEDALQMADDHVHQYLAAGELAYLPSFALPGMAALVDLGRAREALDRYDVVWEACRGAVSWRLRLGSERGIALLAAGEVEAARLQLLDVIEVAKQLPNEHEQAIAERHLAEIERRDQEHAVAEDRLHRALVVQAELGYPQYVADVLEGLAGIELDHGRAEPAAVLFGAASEVRAAAGVVRRLGGQESYEADLSRLHQELAPEDLSSAWDRGAALSLDDAVDLARRGRGARGRPASGWESLTATELKVAALVAEGRTNPEIAHQLLMGRATAKTHVSNILRKLGLANRTQVAGAAARRADQASR